MSAKFTVAELAKMMGKAPKEVLFLLQGIGVDVKSVESVLDPSTAQAILAGKTQAPKTLIVRQTPAVGASVVAARVKTERAALKRIKIVERPPGAEAEVEVTGTVEVEAPAPPPVSASAAPEAPVAAAPVAAPEVAEPEPAAPAPGPSAPVVVEAAAAAQTTQPAEHPVPESVAAQPVVAPASVAPSPAPPPPPVVSAPPRRPPTMATAGLSHRPAARPALGRAPVPAPPKPPLPGALGRILRRTGELPSPRSSAVTASPTPPQPPEAPPSSVVADPNTMGLRTARPIQPAAAPASGSASPAPPQPLRGAGGLGRAVIAPPTPATTRTLRSALQSPSPVARPAVPARPGAPMRLGPPGAAPRPGYPPRPGFGPRPGLGQGAPPLIPPAPGGPADKRRKDAAKPGVAPKKDDAKKGVSKKPRTKEVSALEEDVREYLGSFKPDTYDDVQTPALEGAEDGRARPLSKSAQRRAGKKTVLTDTGNVAEVKKAASGPVFLSEGVTVKELGEKTGILAKDLMKSLLARGIFATINQTIVPKVAVEIAKEFGIEAAVVSFEEELELSRQQAIIDQAAIATSAGTAPVSEAVRSPRAPVVTVMGHVDHGKTSLLDSIRKANVAEGEAGGITQHIGAYRVVVNGRRIVFLDTPGHEAFTMMRARGAKATDIVVLVVAADDGVMPQTLEAIDHARAAKVPIVVAINKIDKPDANVGRVKQELAEKGVLIEEFGGEVVSCEISAKKKIGIDHLLEMILLQAELLELKGITDGPARGVVLEARREVGRGTLATVLVQQGSLRVGDVFFAGAAVGRVRAMLDDRGQRLDEAGPAVPVEVMGFEDLPDAGDTLQVVEDEGKARQVSAFRVQKEREESLAKSSRMSLDSLFNRMREGAVKDLALIIKADVHGSEEVLVQTLSKLSTEKVKVSVLHSGVGAISVNDVLLASASEAIIIGFAVRPEKKAQELADKEGVDIRLYSVIYTLTDEIKKAMAGLLETVKKEVARGRAEVRETFRVPKVGTVAGCMVTEGTIPRSASARLLRDNRVIFEGKIGSLRRFKDDAAEVKSGFECGIGIAGYQDIKIGDVIEAFVVEEVAPSLN